MQLRNDYLMPAEDDTNYQPTMPVLDLPRVDEHWRQLPSLPQFNNTVRAHISTQLIGSQHMRHGLLAHFQNLEWVSWLHT